MSVLIPVIESIDGATRRIYLKQGVSDFYPIEDIYHEYRHLRRTDESLRKWNPLLKAEGNVSKGAGAFTPRYVVLLDGTKLVPFDESIQINQLGDMITDDPDVDPLLYDISGLTTAKPIFIKPSEAETIQLNSDAIEYSSYGGVVSIRIGSGNAGTKYPVGNKEYPVDNVKDAVDIAIEKGFDTLSLLGSMTLGIGDDVSDMIIKGTNPMTSILTVLPEAITNNLYVRDLYFTGTLDGGAILRDCVVGDVNYFNGYIEHCALTSATIHVNGVAVIMNCSAGATCISPPVINLNDAAGLAIREYNGNLHLTEKHNTGACQVGMNGIVSFDTTVDTGNVILYGDVWIQGDRGTAPFEVIDYSSATKEEIAQAVHEFDTAYLLQP